MALITRPIRVDAGAWITSRCVVLGGAHIGRSALIRPLSVVDARGIPAGEVWGGNPDGIHRSTFDGVPVPE